MRIYIQQLINCFVATVYDLHPYGEPENVPVMVKHLRNGLAGVSATFALREDFKCTTIEVGSREELFTLLKGILMGCKEYRQLNISRHRWNLGQRDLDDEDKYWNKQSQDPQENDFVDLSAVVQNMLFLYDAQTNAETSCFLCTHAKYYGSIMPGDSDKCRGCKCNPRYINNFTAHPWSLLPSDSEEYKALVAEGKIKNM